MEEKQCPHCKQNFLPTHGNQVYCSEECHMEFKRLKQVENSKIMKQCRSGFLKNYRYFRELLLEADHLSIPLIKLMKKGFDQDAFYGTVIDKEGIHWHKVNEFRFSIIKKDGQLIINLFKT